MKTLSIRSTLFIAPGGKKHPQCIKGLVLSRWDESWVECYLKRRWDGDLPRPSGKIWMEISKISSLLVDDTYISSLPLNWVGYSPQINRRVTSTQWLPSLSASTVSNWEVNLSILKNFRIQSQDRGPRKRLK